MADILLYLIPIAMVAVVGALAMGLLSFAQEGEEARKRSNKMMRYRILFQFIAVVLMLLFVAVSQG
ncbi:MAG: twin transmembrane helix small protein [Pseudomonadota bacterium]